METVLISLITAAWWYLLGLSISLCLRTDFLVYFFSFPSWNKSSASYPYLGDSAHLFGLWTWVLLCHILSFRRKAVLQQSVWALPPPFLSNLYSSSASLGSQHTSPWHLRGELQGDLGNRGSITKSNKHVRLFFVICKHHFSNAIEEKLSADGLLCGQQDTAQPQVGSQTGAVKKQSHWCGSKGTTNFNFWQVGIITKI